MFKALVFLTHHNSDDIETAFLLGREQFHKGVSGPDHESLLLGPHSHVWFPSISTCPCLHFYEDNGFIHRGDYVHLVTTITPVFFKDDVTLLFQMRTCILFACDSYVEVFTQRNKNNKPVIVKL